MNILKEGFLFIAAEAGNHAMYLFKSDGTTEENPVLCNSCIEKPTGDIPVHFNPREPQNLELRDELENLGPINDMRVEDLVNE